MGSTGNQYFELIESMNATTAYNNNNNNTTTTATMNINNNFNKQQQFNSLFDIESNKENSINQSNINNNVNNNNSSNNNNTSSLKISTSKILQNNNNNNSFSIGIYKLPLSPRVSPRIVSSNSNGNSACNSEFSSPQPSSLLEDTLIAINNSDENPLKKHRNSQILSKNFYSLSLHNQDSPKHSRSTTDLSAFFNMSDPDEFMNSRSKTFCGGDLASQFKFDHTFVTTTTTTNKSTENNNNNNNNSNSNNCNSNSGEVIFNNSNNNGGGNVNSLKRSNDGSSAASAFSNGNSGNTTAANSLKSSTCSTDSTCRKSPIHNAHSSSSIPYRYSCSILKTPPVLSSSAPSLLSMLDEADANHHDSSSNTTATSNGINTTHEDESFTLVSTPIKDQTNRSLVLSDDDEEDVNNITDKQIIEEEESNENILIRHQHVNNQDEDEEDDLPPTPIQIRTRFSPASNGNAIRHHSHSLFISKTASNLLSPPLTVSARHSTSLSFLSTNNTQQYYPSSPELSPMIPTPTHKNQSMVDDDSPNTSLDQIGGSPYKTPSKALSFLSPNSPNNNNTNNNNNITTQTGKRSRTCLDFTKYSSHLFDEDTSSTSSQSPTISPKNSNINLNNNICNVKNTTTTINKHTITQTTSNVTTTNTLSAIQQNLNNNSALLKTSGPLSTSTPSIPPYLANHEIYQRSNSVSSSRPPRFLSMSTASFISKQSPDISTLPRPVPFDNNNNINNNNNNQNTTNNNFGNSNSTESNVDNNNHFNNPVVDFARRIVEQQQQQRLINDNNLNSPTQDHDQGQHDDKFKPKLLDIFPNTRAGFNGVSSETVKKLLSDPNKMNASKVTIVDCRYQYEFQGGHIKDAINIPPTGSRQMVLNTFFKEPPKDQHHIIIFHCEFSSKRAPDCYNLFRELDREHNKYPNVYYPEIYLLNGGFKKFWETCVNLCTGDYIRMDDKLYQTHLKEEEEKKKKEKIVTRNIKAFKNRSHSFHV